LPAPAGAPRATAMAPCGSPPRPLCCGRRGLRGLFSIFV
jgi:hypothetical protein